MFRIVIIMRIDVKITMIEVFKVSAGIEKMLGKRDLFFLSFCFRFDCFYFLLELDIIGAWV